MIFKLRIAHWRFTFTLAPVIDVVGVNSILPDGKHIPMWDFDDIPLDRVIYQLCGLQEAGELSNIYILQTGLKDHYIAYCFTSLDWRHCKMAVCAAYDVDENFFKYGVYRDHFTLRVSAKEHGKPKLVAIIRGAVPSNCSVRILQSWVKYETLADNAPMRKREINIA